MRLSRAAAGPSVLSAAAAAAAAAAGTATPTALWLARSRRTWPRGHRPATTRRDVSTAPAEPSAKKEADDQDATQNPPSGIRVTDNRSNVPPPPAQESISKASESGQPISGEPQPSPQQSQPAQQQQQILAGASHEDLLKQRFYHAQSQNKKAISVVGSGATSAFGGSRGDTTIFPPDGEPETSWNAAGRRSQAGFPASPSFLSSSASPFSSASEQRPGSSDASESEGTVSAASSGGSDADGDGSSVNVQYDPRLELPAPAQALRSLEVPFDTHAFVKRLEEGGWTSSLLQDHTEAARLAREPATRDEARTAQDDGEGDVEGESEPMALQLVRRHDPAEAIMEQVRFLITRRGTQTAQACLNKGDVENQAYLFNAALSELRTEVQVRARNDAAALQSITTLLQREVDALDQKMKEDVERLKHDIQVDMNNRKAESKEEQNNLEQEIQDLNNRFTISLSDLKTEIEQNVKWDATRRSLFLVFGIAAIVAANLAIADYMTRDDDAAHKAAHKEPQPAGEPPASANVGAPAALGWAAEGRVLSAWPVATLSASLRFRAAPAMARAAAASIRSASPRGAATAAAVGLHRSVASLAAAPRDNVRPQQRCRPQVPLPTAWSQRIAVIGLPRPLHASAVAGLAAVAAFDAAAASAAPAGSASSSSLTVPETDIRIGLHPTSISIESLGMGLAPFHFDHVWLRDACQAEGSVHQSNRQKLFHTSDVPLGVPLLDAKRPPCLAIREVGGAREHVLRIAFAREHAVANGFTALFREPKAAEAPHVSEFPISFLLHHALPELYAHTHMDVMSVPQTWAAKDMSPFTSQPWTKATQVDPVESSIALAVGAMARPARIPWEAISDAATEAYGADVGADAAAVEEARDEARYALVEATIRDGFAFVTGVPTDKTATAEGEDAATLRELASMLGEIRHTFYGPLWDVQSKPSSDNIAYTNLDLGLHMDLLYFQNPPRFQFLHMLRNRVKGGASIFVDSFKVAERMWHEDRELWEVLTRVPVGFHYVHGGRHYRFTHPTFELAHDNEGHAGPPLHGSTMPRLSAVNYSPPFQSPLPLHPTPHLRTVEDRAKFYTALKRFADLTLDPEFRYQKQLQEGECVIFDNRRVLHSRTGFEWDAGQVSEVTRWLKGCYVDGDAIWSTYRALRTKLGATPFGGGQARGVPTSGRTATNPGGRRGFSTAAVRRADVEVARFAPSSDDPTVMDERSRSAIRSASTLPSMVSYRPVPPPTVANLSKVYRQLSKSRLTFLVVLTGMAGYALCPASLTVATGSPVVTLAALTAGMALCSAAANGLNQLVEAPYDAQMPRTRARPLPSRAVTPLHAFSFATASAVGGVALLGGMVNPLTAALGAANIVLYSFTYTPMKRLSIANTWVGAVVGALPPLMGWAACTGTLHLASDLGAWSLAALLFAWQFPHFNSLAHTLRAEYARGGYRMMAVTDPALNRRVSLRYAVAMVPICSVMLPMSGIVHPVAYALLSLPPNVAMAHAAWRFWREGTQKSAKWCFWVSLMHLPAVMLLAMGCKPELWDGVAQRLGWISASGDEDNGDDEAEGREQEADKTKAV
ncbi:Protoheme IX farnesyltransferase, mitochondrial [Thecaphora frezii]